MRRANGAGNISKLPGKRRKPWRARVTIGWDENGKQLYKTVGYFATKKEAEIGLALHANAPVADNSNITLACLYKLWAHTRAFTRLDQKTQDNYNTAYCVYMTEFHKRKFRDLHVQQFQAMIDKAERLGRGRSTMAKVKTVSGLLCKFAMSMDIVNKNYAQFTILPRAEKKPIPTFSKQDIEKMFKAAGTVPLVDTILILCYTGMRINELLSLKKSHIDLDKMLITGGSKTDAGRNRLIPIHPVIQPFIKARYEKAEEYLLERTKVIGSKKKGTQQIFKARWLYENYRKYYQQALETIDVAYLSPHKARHTFFTMLSEHCTDRKAMALVGGHTDPDFTDRVYVQPDVERLRRAVECI